MTITQRYLFPYLVDGGVGKAPEPVLVIVGAYVVPTDETQKVIGAAFLPLGYAFH